MSCICDSSPEWLKRVVVEKSELETKLKALREFLKKEDVIKGMGNAGVLLVKQEGIMTDYYNVLAERINYYINTM